MSSVEYSSTCEFRTYLSYAFIYEDPRIQVITVQQCASKYLAYIFSKSVCYCKWSLIIPLDPTGTYMYHLYKMACCLTGLFLGSELLVTC